MIQEQPFGRTNHSSTRIVFGAVALARISQEQADQILDLLLRYGINHIDTAASYGDSELRIGPWMKAHRDLFFLATKTDKRTRRQAWDELQRSLDRLRVNMIDLWQMHYLVDPDEWEIAMGPGGALEAFVEARDQGLVRFLGVTGHDLTVAAMHRRSLDRFDFDSVLLPYNYPLLQNPGYAADLKALVDLCRRRDVAVQTIKSLAFRPWGDHPPTRATWYQPFETQTDIDRAVHWVLGRPGIFLNTVGDPDLLPKVFDAAARFEEPPTEAEMQTASHEIGWEPLFTK
jgi:aryl-alcohol dehydrogenase-like predicted oxidoreductase